MTTTEQRLNANLLAEGTEVATRPAGPCQVCSHGILRGDRFAVLVPSGRLVHVACMATMMARRTARPVIR